ncbi:uncharacterized protein [Aegilops tauschii subsp. strangulata]|uniref:Uncharacterized protein n=2 Tax=Aegilops tauschii subsp. strangulata TaxID=200361 RepID=A0A453QFK6_AEGTS|nr:uncharacterized protein LOC109785680 [Aegilops tauschii subsp. strangulata]
MAARALTAAGRRVAGRTGTTPLLASRRNGVSMNHSSASARREEEQYQDVRTAAAAMTGAQVEAALNRKNVEVLQGEEDHVATVLPDETIGGSLDGGEDASWVPDQDTGVFGPAHVDTHGGGSAAAPPHLFGGATAATAEGSAASSSDQDTGAFVPADADADTDTHGGGARPAPPHLYGGVGGTASVLDQAVFVREEDIEDVEKPAAIDMGNANADVNGSIKNY